MGDEVPNWGGLVAPALHKILAKASAAGSFSHCLVNRHWYSLSHGAMSCLKPRATLEPDELRRVLEQCPNLTSIISPQDVDYKPYLPAIAEAYSSKTSLTRLEVLDISSPIPDCLSSLGSLNHLTLKQRTRSGSEDPNLQPIFYLTNLRSLFLEVHKVERLPEELGNLVGLRELGIHESISHQPLLESLPDSLTNLHSLQKLDLNIGCLRTLPPDFHRLRNLTQLKAWGCSEVVGILSGMEEAPRLRELKLGVVQNLPCGLSCLKSTLTFLKLTGLRGLIPSDLGQLSLLEEFSLDLCYDVMTFPESLCGLIALRSLVLNLCLELAEIPAGFSRLTRLESVMILSCRALKELPEDLGDAPSLNSVLLSNLPALRRLPESLLDRVRGDRGFWLSVSDCGNVELP